MREGGTPPAQQGCMGERCELAITERPWCDFVVCTKKGISVERIQYSQEFWRNTLLPKLIDFNDNCLYPSIVAPIHLLGMKVHDLRVHAH